ncbi:hypothetical protein JOC95_002207 [Bacillus tianshenii]|jgi:hypothetical protein|uniref:Uncharacterized protein n=1 Tax=Sutcliffiella tianshenii TaxID=1463404 RepID=A0ABS2P074_9BACI|nr:hypothetical protein [Bacillus tianshenii]MBM7620354.1 hypothetical protein [Bacillus tianshenii]
MKKFFVTVLVVSITLFGANVFGSSVSATDNYTPTELPTRH